MPELLAGDEDTSDRNLWRNAVQNLGKLLFFNVPEVLAAAKGEMSRGIDAGFME